MSISENVNYIKENLSSQEQFLQNAIRSERFIQRHKKTIIAIIIAAVIALGAWIAITAINESKKAAANEAFTALIASPNDANLKADLIAKSPSLFALFALQSGDLTLINEAKSLNTDPLLSDILALASDASTQNSKNAASDSAKTPALMADYSALLAGYKLLQTDPAAAKGEFAKISPTSTLKQIAGSLSHFMDKTK